MAQKRALISLSDKTDLDVLVKVCGTKRRGGRVSTGTDLLSMHEPMPVRSARVGDHKLDNGSVSMFWRMRCVRLHRLCCIPVISFTRSDSDRRTWSVYRELPELSLRLHLVRLKLAPLLPPLRACMLPALRSSRLAAPQPPSRRLEFQSRR